jgi:hypothetical protein
MKLKKTEENRVNYPTGEKYYSFAKFFGSVAVGAAMVVSGYSACSTDKKEKSDTENTIKNQGKNSDQNKKVKPVVDRPGKIKSPEPKIHRKGDIASVQPMKVPVSPPHALGGLSRPQPVNKPVLKDNPVKKPEKVIHMGGNIAPVQPVKKPKHPVRRGRIRSPRPYKNKKNLIPKITGKKKINNETE